MSEPWRQAITWLELSILAIFTAEYLLRLWIAERPWKYAFSLYGLIDLAAILPLLPGMGNRDDGAPGHTAAAPHPAVEAQGIHPGVDAARESAQDSREEATIFLVASALTLYIAAIGIHQFEHEAQPEHFGTLGQSLWWAIGLLVDVDFGEIWPVTFGGKAFTAIIALIGIAIIAVPAGLVASALTKIATEQREGAETNQNERGDDATR